MLISTSEEVCSFCGTVGDESTSYASGFGVLMCADCVSYFAKALPETPDHTTMRYDVASFSDDDLLAMLPRIAASGALVNRFMASWVEHIRARKLSWTAIGNAMGISRQAAWERFTRALGTGGQHSS